MPNDHNAKIHAICPYLRGWRDCMGCPEWENDERRGRVQRGCYGLAQEVVNICQTGNPWRKGEWKSDEIRRLRSWSDAAWYSIFALGAIFGMFADAWWDIMKRAIHG